MSYCTLDDLKAASSEAKLIELTDDENLAPESIDPDNPDHAAIMARISDAIDYADQLIDGYMRTRYALPLVSVPKLITKLSMDLALFYLYGRRFDTEIPEGQTSRYRNAERILQRIQEGKLSLGTDESAPEAPSGGSYVTNKTASDRLFSKEVLEKF